MNLFSAKVAISKLSRSRVVYKFFCTGCSACYVGETNRHLATRVREQLTSDQNSHIFQHIYWSETCRALCSENCFSILDTASTSFQLKIKEALYIGLKNPNKQVNHVILTLSFWFSMLNTYCFFSIMVFSSVLHASCYLAFKYSIKLSFISHWLEIHLYSQLMRDVDHPKHFCFHIKPLRIILFCYLKSNRNYIISQAYHTFTSYEWVLLFMMLSTRLMYTIFKFSWFYLFCIFIFFSNLILVIVLGIGPQVY